jgi:hypothetical protein
MKFGRVGRICVCALLYNSKRNYKLPVTQHYLLNTGS